MERVILLNRNKIRFFLNLKIRYSMGTSTDPNSVIILGFCNVIIIPIQEKLQTLL